MLSTRPALDAVIWAGYIDVTPTPTTSWSSVTATVTVPALTCHKHNDDAAFWVGFDGIAPNSTIEQDGITGTCTQTAGGWSVSYQAWWLMWDAGGSGVFPMSVSPGDVVTIDAAYRNGTYAFTIDDQTTRTTNSATTACAATTTCNRQSAEWIVERAGDSSLAQFSPVLFSHCRAALLGGPALPISAQTGPVAVMNEQGAVPVDLATAGPLVDGGDSFRVVWHGTGYGGDLQNVVMAPPPPAA